MSNVLKTRWNRGIWIAIHIMTSPVLYAILSTPLSSKRLKDVILEIYTIHGYCWNISEKCGQGLETREGEVMPSFSTVKDWLR